MGASYRARVAEPRAGLGIEAFWAPTSRVDGGIGQEGLIAGWAGEVVSEVGKAVDAAEVRADKLGGGE